MGWPPCLSNVWPEIDDELMLLLQNSRQWPEIWNIMIFKSLTQNTLGFMGLLVLLQNYKYPAWPEHQISQLTDLKTNKILPNAFLAVQFEDVFCPTEQQICCSAKHLPLFLYIMVPFMHSFLGENSGHAPSARTRNIRPFPELFWWVGNQWSLFHSKAKPLVGFSQATPRLTRHGCHRQALLQPLTPTPIKTLLSHWVSQHRLIGMLFLIFSVAVFEIKTFCLQ